MTIQMLEDILKSKIVNCDIIADLQISTSTHEKLGKALSGSVSGDIRLYLKVMELYPLCCAAHMIFFRVYSESDDYWTSWSDSIGMSLDSNEQGLIGQKLRRILDINGFSYDDDGNVNISAIDCQAGIQNRNLHGIFNILDGAEYHELKSLVYDVTGSKSYTVHKAVERLAKNHHEKALGIFADILDVMQSDIYAYDDADLNVSRIYKHYIKWRENWNTQTSGKKRTALIERTRPELVFNADGKGLSLLLPAVPKSNEYASKATWKVAKKEITVRYTRSSDNDERTDTAYLSVLPQAEYNVELFDDISRTALQRYPVYGVKRSDFLLFNSSGKRLESESLPTDGYLFIMSGTAFQMSDSIHSYEVELPPEQRSFKAYYFGTSGEDSEITIGKTTLVPRQEIKISLSGTYLFGEKPNGSEVPIYTEIPNLIYDELNDSIILTISCKERKYKQTFKIPEYGKVYEDLKDKYGSYRIRIDEDGTYRTTLQFIYLPYIESSDSGLKLWPGKRGLPETEFIYKECCNVTIVSDCNAIKTGDWYSIRLSEPVRVITGAMVIIIDGTERKYIWKKTVRSVVWRVLYKNEDQTTENERSLLIVDSIDDAWFCIEISTAFECTSATLLLTDKNSNILQELDVTPGANGKRGVSLGTFSDTARNIMRPIEIALLLSGYNSSIPVIHLIGELYLPNLKYGYNEKKGRAIIAWDKNKSKLSDDTYILQGITNPDFSVALALNNVKQMKDPGRHGISFDMKLENGLYAATAVNTEDDFFTSIGFEPPKVNDYCLIKVGVKGSLLDVFLNTLNSMLLKFDDSMAKFLCTIIQNYGDDETLCEALTQFSEERLSDEHRGEIIARAATFDIADKIAEKYAKVLKLLFFKMPQREALDVSINRLAKFDPTIQLLWTLRSGNMSVDHVNDIKDNAQEDFKIFFSEFEKKRLEQIEALQNRHTLREIKGFGPENHFEIYRRNLEPLYKRFDSHAKTLPGIFKDFIAKRKPKRSDEWKSSVSALFYYSAICSSMAVSGVDDKAIHSFHDTTEKHYPELYHVIKRDLLIVETISMGD